MNLQGFRKLIIASILLISATVLVALNTIDQETYKWVVIMVSGTFFAANVAAKLTN